MISITADSYWQPMAKQQHLQLSWTHVGAIIAAIVSGFWVVTSVVNQDIRDRLLSIDNSISQINITLRAHGESLVGIDLRMKDLDRRVEALEKPYWEPKARASGFKSPDIVSASLQPQVKFVSKVERGTQKFFLQVTILNYDEVEGLMTLEVNEASPDNTIGRGNTFVVSAKPGQPVIVPHFYPGAPKIYMQVLGQPSPNRAILAIGERVNPHDKHS